MPQETPKPSPLSQLASNRNAFFKPLSEIKVLGRENFSHSDLKERFAKFGFFLKTFPVRLNYRPKKPRAQTHLTALSILPLRSPKKELRSFFPNMCWNLPSIPLFPEDWRGSRRFFYFLWLGFFFSLRGKREIFNDQTPQSSFCRFFFFFCCLRKKVGMSASITREKNQQSRTFVFFGQL